VDTSQIDNEELGVNVIRALGMDGPGKANSGHQGTAMALAPLAHVLFTRIMRYDASNPEWPDRDRFVLSVGHASILLYSMLYLTGYGLKLDDLKEFRQWNSATPGHPEAEHTDGVEVTTGPLGQGIANSVGLAMAEHHLRAKFGPELCDHFTYVIAGDGDLSEGVSHEAASLAGHLGLGRLVVIYDDNHISIDGPTELALSDDAAARFGSYGWHVENLGEVANDLDAIEAGINRAKEVTDKPSLVILRSHIGYPSEKFMDTSKAHGLAFDDEEIAAVKETLGLPNEPFWVPDEVVDMYREAGSRGRSEVEAWNERVDAFDGDKEAWKLALSGDYGTDWQNKVEVAAPGTKHATRQTSQKCVTALAASIPGFIGGSADLTGSNGASIGGDPFSRDNPTGRQIHFGIREHGMGSALVGMAKHGGVLPFGGTFLVFADYMRPPVRLAAMSEAQCVFVWTHDSVGVGEDGPTHQPVEQVMSLRAIPKLQLIRPGDLTESIGAWQAALDFDGPTALILSRQGVPELEGTSVEGVLNGGYIIQDTADPDIVLIGTGTELHLCVEAAETLKADGVSARVVSMPCWERFDALEFADQELVLPSNVPALSIEAGVTLGWERYADVAIGIDRFGASAPGGMVMENLGINTDNIVDTTKQLLEVIKEAN